MIQNPDPQPPRAILMERGEVIFNRARAASVALDGVVFEPEQTRPLRANPNGARAIFVYRIDDVARQALWFGVGCYDLSAQPVQSVEVRSEPEISFPVFMYGEHRTHILHACRRLLGHQMALHRNQVSQPQLA